MKVQLLIALITILFGASLITSCAATNGWSSPNNYCFYHAEQCAPCALSSCNKPGHKTCPIHGHLKCFINSCKYCQQVCRLSPAYCSTTCCDYSYVFNCCDNRHYWEE